MGGTKRQWEGTHEGGYGPYGGPNFDRLYQIESTFIVIDPTLVIQFLLL